MVDISRLTWPSIAFIDHPFEKACELVAGAGFKNIDVLEKMPHLSLFPEEQDPADLKAAADKHGLRIANLGTYVGGGQDSRGSAWLHHPGFKFSNKDRYTSVGFASADEKDLETELEQVKRAVDIAVSLGARSIRFAPGDDDYAKMDKLVPWLKECAKYAEEKNVYMATENHDAGLMGSPEKLVEMFEKIGSDYVGVIYEPLNLMDQAGYDYRKALEVMRDHIVHVHLKDGRLDPDLRSYKPTLMGEGEFDFRWVVNRLEQIGYKDEIALEYEVAEVPPEEGIHQFIEGFYKMIS